MPPFNIIDAAQYAYRMVWQERQYLMRLAFIPIIIKIICLYLSVTFGEPGNIIRHGLFMLPAYFAEGWALCHFVRLMTKGQRWPYKMTGDAAEDLRAAKVRGRPLLAGILAFVLINLAIALYYAFFMSFVPPEILQGEQVDPESIPPQTAMTVTLLFVFLIFVFKYVWLYIPLASNSGILPYVHKTRGFGISFRMIALWLVCFVPTIFVTQAIGSFFTMPDLAESPSADFILAIIRVIFDTIKNFICTAGLTFAMLQLFNGQQKGGKA